MRKRLTFSFLLIAIVSIVTVVIIARRNTLNEVQAFMFRGSMVEVDSMVNYLSDYYQTHRSWDGVARQLQLNFRNMGRGASGQGVMMNQRIRLADTAGNVVVDTRNPGMAGVLSRVESAAGTPIIVEGKTVGTLLVEGGMGFSGTDRIFLLTRLNRAAIIAGVVAGGLALVLALLLSDRLLRPIQHLTQASTRLAKGDLGQRVQIQGDDELAVLGEAFNHMADSLQMADESRQALTADIAHELRTPLAVQRAHLEALQDGIYPPTPENLQPILEQNFLLTHLVDDLRTLALADAGQLALEKTPTDVNALVIRLVERFKPQAEQSQVDLSFQADQKSADPVKLIYVDPMRVDQIMGNLLTNALRHTLPGGRIKINLSLAREWVTITIHDSGPGIPDDALPHIFERFYRADHSRSRSEGGSGLGLAIARHLTEAQGGTLTAANHPQGGAVFTLAFPTA